MMVVMLTQMAMLILMKLTWAKYGDDVDCDYVAAVAVELLMMTKLGMLAISTVTNVANTSGTSATTLVYINPTRRRFLHLAWLVNLC